MTKKRRGNVFLSQGQMYARITTPDGTREAVLLPKTCTVDEANAKKELMTEMSERLGKEFKEHVRPTMTEIANAPISKFTAIRRSVELIVAGQVKKTIEEPTFKEVGEMWTSGKLHERFPDRVEKKATSDNDAQRLEKYVYPHVGHVRMKRFADTHAELVLEHIPKTLAPKTRKQIAQVLQRVIHLAINPLKALKHSPLPDFWMPQPKVKYVKQFLYPAEEAELLACADVPLKYRFFYGFLAREGMRLGEATALKWSNIDNSNVVTLAKNKTNDPRAWKLGNDTARALRWLKENTARSTYVFGEGSKQIHEHQWAPTFRRHLKAAGVLRAALFASDANTLPIRLHDLRATFVTLSLANGKTEAWVCDRTGHKSSQMLAEYRRPARMATELELGPLRDMCLALGLETKRQQKGSNENALENRENND